MIQQGASESDLGFVNRLLKKNNFVWRSAVNENKEQIRFYYSKIKIPQKLQQEPNFVLGIIVADDKKAVLDKNGCYRVQFLHDRGEQQIVWMDRTQVTGMHLPLYNGTLVVVGIIDNNIDRPFIVGAIPSIDGLSPVTSANKLENRWRTPMGHEISMIDDCSANKIMFNTYNVTNSIVLDNSKENNNLSIETQNGDLKFIGKKAIHINADRNIIETVRNNITENITENYFLETKKGSVFWKTGGDITLAAKNKVTFNSREAMHWQTLKQLQTVTRDRSLLQANHRDLVINTEQGNIKLIAGNDIKIIGQGKGMLSCMQLGDCGFESAGFSITTTGEIIITGDLITVKAQQINMVGKVTSVRTSSSLPVDLEFLKKQIEQQQKKLPIQIQKTLAFSLKREKEDAQKEVVELLLIDEFEQEINANNLVLKGYNCKIEGADRVSLSLQLP